MPHTFKGALLGAISIAVAVYAPCASAKTWHVEKDGVAYAIEQSPDGVAMLVDNAGSEKVTVHPEDIKLASGKDGFPICVLYQVGLYGLGSMDLAVDVRPGDREGYVLGDCSPQRERFVIRKPLTSVSVNGLALRPGNPNIPHAH